MVEWHHIIKNTGTHKLMNGKFYIILFIFCEFADRFVALRKSSQGHCSSSRGSKYNQFVCNVTGPEQPICSTMRTI